ncbi:MAG TPA: hypothetical protein VFB15_10015 [Candidatus Binataceae bacterium]|nr:hypothetical protein [Candidatus Binataceae bacterium]
MSDNRSDSSSVSDGKIERVFALLSTQGADLLKSVQAGDAHLANLNPAQAIPAYQQAVSLYNSIPANLAQEVGALTETEVNEVLSRSGADEQARALIRNAALILKRPGWLNASLTMAFALYALKSQSFREAAGYYQSASKLYADMDDDPGASSLAEYAQAMAQFATGNDYAMRGQRDEALAQIEQAISTLESDLMPSAGADDGDRLLMDLMGFKTTKYMIALSSDAISGDFAVGLHRAGEVLSQLDDTDRVVERANVPRP